MKNPDIIFFILPIIVFLIHLIWGPEMKIFGYDDGGNPTIILLVLMYIAGLTLVKNDVQVLGYVVLIASCCLRPAFHHLWQFIAHRYVEKHQIDEDKNY